MNPTQHRTNTHALTFEVPTTRDYLTGGFGDLVAQCSCGAFEYVYSRTEGAYWHGLHLVQPKRHPHYLMLEAPMPEGWVEPSLAIAVVPAKAVAQDRAYTCMACNGAGTVAAENIATGGRFYHYGERRPCADCGATGRTDRWAA